MSDGGGFGGFSLLELFKLEAEAHCAALSEGLLALEKSPNDRAVVEPLMRAAHSIKGAARIVGLDVIVSLAHTMEECFLAAKSGKEVLRPARVDQLLKGVDILDEVRALAEADLAGWSQAQADRIAALVAQLQAPAESGPAETAPIEKPVAVAEAPKPVASIEVASSSSSSSSSIEAAPTPVTPVAATTSSAVPGTVRVASGVMNRILFLAGDSTVEANRLQDLRALMSGLKARERKLDNAVEDLRAQLRSTSLTPVEAGGTNQPVGAAASRINESFHAVASASSSVQTALNEQVTRFDEAFRRMEELSGAIYSEVLRSRMRPFSEGVAAFPRMVRDIARQLGKSVQLKILGESVEVDRESLQKLESPLTHMIRNSLDHGIELPDERLAAGKSEAATITLAARHQSGSLVIEVRDDGRGINPESIRSKIVERGMVDAPTAAKMTRAELLEFLFLPGFSTKQAVTELSGRGVGLDVVQSTVREISGSVTLDSELGRGTRFTIRLPVTRSVIRAAIVRIGTELFAVPLARLDRVLLLTGSEIQPVQGRLQFTLDDASIGLVHATEVLGGEAGPTANDSVPVLVIGIGENRCGLIVEQVCGEEDLVVRPLDARLGGVAHIAASAIRSDGEPVFVVDVDDLVRSLKVSLQGGRMLGIAETQAEVRKAKKRILIVDDSITVREVERQLLMRRGYDVDVAVDGREGYSTLRAGKYDLMVTDVDMPRMTGIELIRAVRREAKFAELPIIIVSYKDREADRIAGLEAGASAYLTKSSFQDDSLIRTVENLIGASI